MKVNPEEKTIDLRDSALMRARRPLLVAHRGGVVAANAPENSLAAIRLAAIHGYDMVELDVRQAKDGGAVLFHGTGGRGLWVDCGVHAFLEDLTTAELTNLCYRGSTEHILTLTQALDECASHGLGVMLDIKAGSTSRAFLQQVDGLLRQYLPPASSVTIADDPMVREVLGDQVILPVSREDVQRVSQGQAVPLQGQFWFGWAGELPNSTVPLLQRNGAFSLVSINTFHYPAHAHQSLARQDIQRLLAAGVEGFQIDSVYEPHFGISMP